MFLKKLLSDCINASYNKIGNDVNYALKKENNILYLFFQESRGKIDWKRNFDFPAKAYKRMGKTMWFAHRGFLRSWKEVELVVAKLIADSSIKKVVIVGYSHGAAIAMLAHEYIWFHRSDLREVLEGYGFAAPRVFWGWKCKSVKERWKNFFVVRNRGDFVTHLPPWIFGFSHVGNMIKVGRLFKYSFVGAHMAENIMTELELFEKRINTDEIVFHKA